MIFAAEFRPIKLGAAPKTRGIYPRIDLAVCPWCKGSTKFEIGSKVYPCTQCAGRGSIVSDNA